LLSAAFGIQRVLPTDDLANARFLRSRESHAAERTKARARDAGRARTDSAQGRESLARRPRELPYSLVSALSDSGVAIKEIAH
jgi:hypothetical protein